jgi:hypothetical protein
MLPRRIYNTAYNKSWTLRNRGPTMKMPHASGASNKDTTLLNAISLCAASYAWVVDTARNYVITLIDGVRSPSCVEFVLTTLNFIMSVIHEMSYTVTQFSKDVNKGVMSQLHDVTVV